MKLLILALFAFLIVAPTDNAHAQRPLLGSYLRSCQDARLQGGTLTADCRDRRGRYARTRLPRADTCTGDIENRNGELVCRPPTDSYVQTCRQISARNGTLRATCERRNGREQSTQLANFRRYLGRINNCDGKLTPRRC